jgi:hypothetical protein
MPNRALSATVLVLAVAAAGCAHQRFAYSVLATAPEPVNNAAFREAIRDMIKGRYALSHTTVTEVPNLESLNRDVRHCRDATTRAGCSNVGTGTVVIIDTITFATADTAHAFVTYFISEPTRPELRFSKTWILGVRSGGSAWVLKETPISMGTMY